MRLIPGNGVFVLLLSGVFACCISAGNAATATAVVDIRFGVVEPPVVAQKDITVRAPTSNQRLDEEPLECSGIAWYEGQLLISSDRHEHLIFTCPVDLDKMAIGTPSPKVIIHNERQLVSDAEALTVRILNGQSSLLMMSSLSNSPDGLPLPHRRHMFWANIRSQSPFEVSHNTVIPAETIRNQLESLFDKIRQPPYYAYNADFAGGGRNTYRWGNVEGISFTPDGQTLLCGMRNPLHGDAAIVFAVAGVPHAVSAMDPDAMTVTDLFLLDLGGRGVSDLAWDAVTQGYLITAAKSNGPRLDPDTPYPPMTLESALFWWSGHKSDGPILIARIPDMTIEAVCRLGLTPYIVLGSDEGDQSEMRPQRQSVLTVMEFTGISREP